MMGFCFCMDLVAWYHLHAMLNCSYAPLARDMTSMVHEGKFHASFGARRACDLSLKADYQIVTKAGREEIPGGGGQMVYYALNTFCKTGSNFANLSVTYGIRKWNNEELLAKYKEEIDKKIAAIGLVVRPEGKERKIL